MLLAVRSRAIRLLEAEVMETLLRGCVTWALNAIYCDKLRKAHFKVLQRVLGFQRHADHTNPSYAKGPQKDEMREHRYDYPGTAVLTRWGNGTAKQGTTTQPGDVCSR